MDKELFKEQLQEEELKINEQYNQKMENQLCSVENISLNQLVTDYGQNDMQNYGKSDKIYEEEIFEKDDYFKQNHVLHFQTLIPEFQNQQQESSENLITDFKDKTFYINLNLTSQNKKNNVLQQNMNQCSFQIGEEQYSGQVLTQEIIEKLLKSIQENNTDIIQINKILQRIGNQNSQLYNQIQDDQLNSSQKKSTTNNIEGEMRLIKEENYFLNKFIAIGGEGIVFDGYYLNENNRYEEVVFKFLTEYSFNSILKEINIMRLFVNNPCVVKLIDSIRISKDLYIIILEKCSQNLSSELQQIENHKQFPLSKLIQIILDLLDGLIQLRIYNILHLDIKPQNILINSEGDYVYSDFGISLNFRDKSVKSQNIRCTKYYAPEEQIKKKLEDLGYKSDVYSLGKTFQEVIAVYKSVNQIDINQILMLKFEMIVKKYMTLYEINEIPNRKECEILQQLFLDQIPKEKVYFEKYYQKLKKIINAIPQYDNPDVRDTPYAQERRLYYQKLENKLNKKIFSNYKEMSYQHYNIALSYYYLGEYQKALENSFKPHFEENIFSEKVIMNALTLGIIGNCYVELNDFDSALRYCLESNNILKTYQENKKIEMAESLNNKQIEIDESLNHIKIEIAESLNNIKRCYQGLNNYEKAFKYLVEYIEISYQIIIEHNKPYQLPVLMKTFSQQNYLILSERQLEMIQLLYPKKAYLTSDLLSDIGELYFENEDICKTIEFQKLSINIKKKIYPNNHPKIQNIIHYHLLQNNNKNIIKEEDYEEQNKGKCQILEINDTQSINSSLYEITFDHRVQLFHSAKEVNQSNSYSDDKIKKDLPSKTEISQFNSNDAKDHFSIEQTHREVNENYFKKDDETVDFQTIYINNKIILEEDNQQKKKITKLLEQIQQNPALPSNFDTIKKVIQKRIKKGSSSFEYFIISIDNKDIFQGTLELNDRIVKIFYNINQVKLKKQFSNLNKFLKLLLEPVLVGRYQLEKEIFFSEHFFEIQESLKSVQLYNLEKFTFNNEQNFYKEEKQDKMLKFKQNQDLIMGQLEKKGYFLSEFLNQGDTSIFFNGFKLNSVSKNEYFVFKIIFDISKMEVEKQLKILKCLEKNISTIKLFDWIEVSNNIFILVLEKCKYSLKDQLIKFLNKEIEFTQYRLFKIITNLLDNLLQFRIYNILHRDIRPGNILVNQFDDYVFTSFKGSSILLDQDKIQVEKEHTPQYFLNEQIAQCSANYMDNSQNDIFYLFDVYSLGETFNLVIEVYNKVNPNKDISVMELLIQEKMLQEELCNRQDCISLYKSFYEYFSTSSFSTFFELYSKQIGQILSLEVFNKNIDLPYCLNILECYQKIQIDILINQKKTTSVSHSIKL